LGGRDKGNRGISSFQTAKETVDAIGNFFWPVPVKIKLAGVHSISVTKDKKVDTSRSLKKVSTDATYQKVFYFKNLNNDYDLHDNSAYESLV
jgi:hypothetical protein